MLGHHWHIQNEKTKWLNQYIYKCKFQEPFTELYASVILYLFSLVLSMNDFPKLEIARIETLDTNRNTYFLKNDSLRLKKYHVVRFNNSSLELCKID